MPYKKGLTPFTHPASIRYLVRKLYPTLGAKRTAQVTGVSTRSVYRWCFDLIGVDGRRRTAAAADANAERGAMRRYERNMRLLEMMGDETDPETLIQLAHAIQ